MGNKKWSLGHEDSITKFPDAGPLNVFPFSSYNAGLTPKNGSVADPGFAGVIPEIGDIKTEPVSVCHHVSTISHFDILKFIPYCLAFSCHLSRLCFIKQASPFCNIPASVLCALGTGTLRPSYPVKYPCSAM